MSLAALAAGADGLLIEVHPDPDHAASDSAQTLDFTTFDQLLSRITALAPAFGKTMS
jgi:3-deoxy-7-phosphoheptulonate synthase